MSYQDRKGYYLSLIKDDVIGRMEDFLRNRGYFLRDKDGKITAVLHRSWDTPWHHTYGGNQPDCYLWHSIIFEAMGFVPSGCLSCFKVVVRPKTLKQLFALLDLQIKMDVPSKCGIETRDTVRGLYGGYFYNRSLDEGVQRYREVKQAMAEDPVLSPLLDFKDGHGFPSKVILKRGCTEFEQRCGRSDKWDISEEDFHTEQLITQHVVPKAPLVQNEQMLKHTHSRWIRWAWKYDDPTVDEFTNGVPLYPPVAIYHHLAEKEHNNGSGA